MCFAVINKERMASAYNAHREGGAAAAAQAAAAAPLAKGPGSAQAGSALFGGGGWAAWHVDSSATDLKLVFI